MADFRLRIGFAKSGPAIWLSHLELIRAMERCLRRSGLPYAISQGFNPHIKHSFSAALPVGTGSWREYMDVDMASYAAPEQALQSLQVAQHPLLPVQSVAYIHKDEPSLQVAMNLATYLVELDDPDGNIAPEMLLRLQTRHAIEVEKKRKLKHYDLSLYLQQSTSKTQIQSRSSCLQLSMISRPEGSLRPEVLLAALAKPDLELRIISITRIALDSLELDDDARP